MYMFNLKGIKVEQYSQMYELKSQLELTLVQKHYVNCMNKI